MSRLYSIFALSLLGSSCSFSKWWPAQGTPQRTLASTVASELMYADKERFTAQVEEKLFAIHSYYTIGQLNLHQFDQNIESGPLKKLYSSKEYHNLQAVRMQIEEIEEELSSVYKILNAKKGNEAYFRTIEMKEMIENFSKKSFIATLSMQNLLHKMGVKISDDSTSAIDPRLRDITAEYNIIDERAEFMIYENNIEHLSNSLSFDSSESKKKFFPTTGNEGNISGNEFPEKVWALTFEDGPQEQTSSHILKELQAKGLTATFFQLSQKALAHPETSHQIRNAGMEIGSHSNAHKQLTKISSFELEKEISTTTNELKTHHGIGLKFYRLPYGEWINKSAIRQKIFENGLIHVHWNVDSLDWMPQSSEKIVKRVKALMRKTKKDAGILRFHDVHMRTAEASTKIMIFLKRDGRRVCTIGEIVNQMNEGVKKVCPKK